jgi:hypothetical protein
MLVCVVVSWHLKKSGNVFFEVPGMRDMLVLPVLQDAKPVVCSVEK